MAGGSGNALCSGCRNDAIKRGATCSPTRKKKFETISELLRLVQNIIATLCCSDTDRDFSEFHHKSPDF